MNYFTDFADQAVLLPLAFIVAASLGLAGWWRGAGAWLLGVGATLVLMLLLKLAFIACGPGDILRSPSGHTAAAAVVCGGLAAVLARQRYWALPVAFVAAVLIGGSRLALGVHTPLEVLLGGAVGIAGAGLTAAVVGPMPELRRNRIVLAAIVTVVVLHGVRMPAEAHIRDFAQRVALFLPACSAR